MAFGFPMTGKGGNFGVGLEVKNWFFDRPKVQRLVKDKTLTALSKAGDRTRKAARRLIGNPSRRKPRPAGKPPRARTDDNVATLRNILYGFVPGQQTVIVGPLRLNMRNYLNGKLSRAPVPAVHEFGGQLGVREKLVGREWRSIGRSKPRPGQPVRVRIAKYQARPFMGPALKKVLPQFPSLWGGQSQGEVA